MSRQIVILRLFYKNMNFFILKYTENIIEHDIGVDM